MMGPRFFIKRNGMEEVSLSEASILNEQGMDAYWVFNGFQDGKPRRNEFLTEIRTFFVDTDSVPKAEVMRICQDNLTPSSIIETVRGFHLYWHLKVPIDASGDPEHYSKWFREFVKSRMVPVFKGDPNACDVLRLLRPWGFKYWKDGSGQEVKLIYGDEFWYDLKEIEEAFPVVELKPKPVVYTPPTRSVVTAPSNNIEDKLPSDEWLKRLSGHPLLRSERYELKPNGMVDQIVVNGKVTSCWVDMNGRIGSHDEGGPTILQWVMWYGLSQEAARRLLEDVYNAV